MIKNECEIVKDLLPNYIENQMSDVTREFIDEHNKNCENCSKIFYSFADSNEKNIDEEKKDKFEIDFLKKYNRKITIFKVIALFLSVLILFTWGLTLACLIKIRLDYDEAKYIYEIINAAYNKNQDIIYSKNYSLTETHISKKYGYINTLTRYYKGKYCKEESNYSDSDTSSYSEIYGALFNFENVEFQLIETDPNYDESTVTGYSYSSISQNLLIYENEKLITHYLTYDIETKEYDGVEYYVITDTKTNYVTMINKDTMLLYKRFSPDFEITYEWSIGTVTDEDLILDGLTSEDMEKINEKIEHTFYNFFIPFKFGI